MLRRCWACSLATSRLAAAGQPVHRGAAPTGDTACWGSTASSTSDSIHALEDAVFYGNEGRIRLQTLDCQSTQAAALALVSSAIVTWNTHRMNEIIGREQADGRLPADLDVARLSPAIHAHINLNGRYDIHPDQPPRHRTPSRDALATYL